MDKVEIDLDNLEDMDHSVQLKILKSPLVWKKITTMGRGDGTNHDGIRVVIGVDTYDFLCDLEADNRQGVNTRISNGYTDEEIIKHTKKLKHLGFIFEVNDNKIYVDMKKLFEFCMSTEKKDWDFTGQIEEYIQRKTDYNGV